MVKIGDKKYRPLEKHLIIADLPFKLIWRFACVGLVQLGLDSFLFVALVGISKSLIGSYLFARATAAVIGYALNGKYTFNRDNSGLSRLFRFVIYWIFMSTLGAVCLKTLNCWAGANDHYTRSIFGAKIIIEIVLFAISFLIAKFWVYEHGKNAKG